MLESAPPCFPVSLYLAVRDKGRGSVKADTRNHFPDVHSLPACSAIHDRGYDENERALERETGMCLPCSLPPGGAAGCECDIQRLQCQDEVDMVRLTSVSLPAPQSSHLQSTFSLTSDSPPVSSRATCSSLSSTHCHSFIALSSALSHLY